MSKKFYAVKCGLTPGIYNSWEECKQNVIGFSGSKYKSFETYEEAQKFMNGEIDYDCKSDDKKSEPSTVNITESIYSFVDGSFNPKTNIYGCGGFLVVEDKKYIIQGNGNDLSLASMRNVAGEILGSMLAIKKAIELNLKEITIYYDYLGIQMWAENKWKTNKKGTQDYKNFIENSRKVIDIKFKKVKGHSGIEGNEEADKLAKEAVGIK